MLKQLKPLKISLLSFFLITLLLSISISGCASSLETRVNLLLIDKDYSQAETKLKAELDPASDQPDLKYMLAKVLWYQNRTDEAQKLVQQAIVLEPFEPEYHLLAARIYMSGRMYFESARASSTVIKLDSNYLEAYWLLGKAYEMSLEFDLALEQYKLALSLEPLYLKAKLGEVRVSFLMDRSLPNVSNLVNELEKLLKNHPANQEGHLLLVKLLESIGRTYRAEKVLLDLIQTADAGNELYFFLAEFYYRQNRVQPLKSIVKKHSSQGFQWKILELKVDLMEGRFTDLSGSIQSLTEKEQKDRDVLLIRAEMELHQGNIRASDRWLRLLQSLYPESPDSYWLKANIQEKNSDYQGALASIHEAIKLDSFNLSFRLKEVRLLAVLKRWNELESLVQNLPIDRESFFYKQLMADLFFWKKEYDKAGKLYRQLEVQDYQPEIEKQIAKLDIIQGRDDQAQKRLQKLLKVFPDDSEAGKIVSRLYYAKGSYSNAIKQLNKLVTDGEEDAQVYLLLSESYILAGKKDNALAILRKGYRKWRDNLKLVDTFTYYLKIYGKLNEAVSILPEYAERSGEYQSVFLKRLAESYLRLGNTAKFKQYTRLRNQLVF